MQPQRFYTLDVLRGVAALAVVVYHWKYLFILTGATGTDISRDALPFWQILSPFYLKGPMAVDLFFSLSGFVFYWLYAEAIAEREVTPWRFAVLRFSRLYPLHVATLLLAGIGHVLYFNLHGQHFLHTDWKHLLLNLLFINSWGFEDGLSFNVPAWSISIEILLYAVFFLFCRLFPQRTSYLVLISIAGFLVLREVNQEISRGVGSFFLGGCIYFAYRRIVLEGTIDKHLGYLLPLTACFWIVMLAWFSGDLQHSWVRLANVPFFWRLGSIEEIVAKAVLFPLTILVLALHETRRNGFGRRFAWLGDISYSTYLLHFPVILLIAVAFSAWNLDRSLFYSPWFMAAFLASLVALSALSHRYFEVPVQRLLRGRTRDRSSPAASAGSVKHS